MYTRDRCCEERGDVKCLSVEVRKMWLVTHDHDLMRKKDGTQGNEEGKVSREKCA